MLKKLCLFALILCCSQSIAQDTVRLVYYNLLKFPFINSGRITHLQTVLEYVQPDLLLVNELTSSSGANSILNSGLNTNGISYYSKATYVNGPDTENMFYYNNQKFGLLSQDEISTSLRDINEYILYYKESGMNASSDTIYFHLYTAHLKAGNQPDNEADRAYETTSLKQHLAALGNPENVFFGGDMNIYSSFEQAYTNIVSGNGFTLVDPLPVTGNYNNNIVFANHHTQSTRTTSIDGGATGGMDDRFDMIFHSTDVSTSANRVSLVPNSYIPTGQDGLHFNDALLDLPNNTTVPSNVLSSLYYMSDHLPIQVDLSLDVVLSDDDLKNNLQFKHYVAFDKLHIKFESALSGSIVLYDISGHIISTHNFKHSSALSTEVSDLAEGIYLAHVHTQNGNKAIKFWIGNR